MEHSFLKEKKSCTRICYDIKTSTCYDCKDFRVVYFIFTDLYHRHDVMAAHNAPKHDFAPAWLKIPSQENPVSI